MKRIAFLFISVFLSISLLSACAEEGETIVASSANELANLSFHVTGTFDKNSCPKLITDALVGKVLGIKSVNVTTSGDVLVIFEGVPKDEEQLIATEIRNQLKGIKHGLENTKFTYVNQ